MNSKSSLLCCAALLLASVPALAQGTKADYERAANFRKLTDGKVLNRRVEPRWSADGSRLWFRRDTPGGGREFILIETATGIYGGSAGGQNSARALLAHGDFYKVGVSDCGCHDNRMDKIWWNEQWMGWPIGPHYAEQSNVTQARHLQGKLLLIVGELDRNVDPSSTLQVASALVKADKDFDLLIIPGAGHGSAETPYGKRRRVDYFVRHLLGVEPRR